jgi:GxxExxY protein
MTKLLHSDLTHQIIGAYYQVYNGLSRVYPEYIYERAMTLELQRRGIRCRRQDEYEVFYKETLVGAQRLDLFVADEVVVELKAALELTKLHKAQTISYLKVTGKEVALLCNFGSSTPQIERLFFQGKTAVAPTPKPPQEWPENYLDPQLTEQVIGALYDVHTTLGPGFIYRIYANAVYRELKMRGLDAAPRRAFDVFYQGQSVGQVKFEHIEVEGKLLLFPVAVQTMDDIRIKNIKAWLRERKLPLGLVANFYPASLEFVVVRTTDQRG